jgi:hypothetical protein
MSCRTKREKVYVVSMDGCYYGDVIDLTPILKSSSKPDQPHHERNWRLWFFNLFFGGSNAGAGSTRSSEIFGTPKAW